MFSLFRIDDRLVHGQTMIKLLPNYPCDGIIIINDEIAENDEIHLPKCSSRECKTTCF